MVLGLKLAGGDPRRYEDVRGCVLPLHADMALFSRSTLPCFHLDRK